MQAALGDCGKSNQVLRVGEHAPGVGYPSLCLIPVHRHEHCRHRHSLSLSLSLSLWEVPDGSPLYRNWFVPLGCKRLSETAARAAKSFGWVGTPQGLVTLACV